MSAAGSAVKLSLPGPLRLIGKKHIEIASQWWGLIKSFVLYNLDQIYLYFFYYINYSKWFYFFFVFFKGLDLP